MEHAMLLAWECACVRSRAESATAFVREVATANA